MKRILNYFPLLAICAIGIIYLNTEGQNLAFSDSQPYDYGVLDHWNRNTAYDSILDYLDIRYDVWREQNPTLIAETFKYYYNALLFKKTIAIADTIERYENMVRNHSGESLGLSFLYYIKVQDQLENGKWEEARALIEVVASNQFLEEVYPRLYGEAKSLASFIHLAYGERLKALQLNEEADSIFIKYYGKDFFGRIVSINNFSIILENLGRHEEALAYGLQSIDIVKKYYAESHENLPKVLNGLGLKYHNLGRVDEAINTFQEAIRLNKQYGHDLNLFSVYMNISRSYTAKYDYESAGKYLTLAEENLRSKDAFFPHYELEILMRKATSLNDQKDQEHLSSLIQKILKLLATHFREDDYSSAKPFALLFTYYLRNMEYEKAAFYLDKYMQLLSIYVDEDNDEWANGLGWRGELFNAIGQPDSSIVYNNKAIEIYKKTMGPHHHYIFEVMLIQAQAYAQKGDFIGADSVLNHSLFPEYQGDFTKNDLLGIPRYEDLFKHLHLLGTLKLKLKYATLMPHQNDSLLLLSKAEIFDYLSKEYDRLLAFYGGYQHREDLREGSSDVFRKAIAVCYDLYELTNSKAWIEKAFEYSERTKALKIQEILREKIANIEGGIPDSLRRKESELLLHKLNLQELFDKSSMDDSLQYFAVKTKLAEASIAHERFVAHLEQIYPNYYNLKYNVNLANPELIKSKMLNKDRALVQFNIWNDSCYVIITAVGRDDFIKVSLPENFQEKVYQFYDAQKSRSFEAYNEYGSYIFDHVYKPLEASLSSFKELIVVPDGWLFYINLESLPITDTPGRYLIQKHQIYHSYSPTVSVQHITVQNQLKAELEWVGIVPGFEKKSQNNGAGSSYVSQPWAVELARTIKVLFKSELFEGEAATKEALFKEGSKGKLLHIGTHAVADDDDPMNSYMVLADEAAQGYELLRASDLYNKEIKSICTVLTACETAVGKIRGGEGMVSLARAFSYAGCPNLVVTLWSVDDQQTANIMKGFYQNIVSGSSFPAALHQSKLYYLETNKGELKHPFYWAGIIYYGGNIPLHTPSYRWLLWVFMGFIITAFLGVYVYKKTKPQRLG